EAAPPVAVVGRGVAPDAGAGLDGVGVEAGVTDPGGEAAAGVGLEAVGVGDLVVEHVPLGELGRLGVPGHGGVVGVADGDEAAGPGDALHLAQRGDGVGE